MKWLDQLRVLNATEAMRVAQLVVGILLVLVTPLVGGITNQNYRVDIGGETFVLRIGGKETQLLGIDRGREHTCTAIAAQIGVGAEVIHFLASEDVLITRFIVGTGISPEAAAQPETVFPYFTDPSRYIR